MRDIFKNHFVTNPRLFNSNVCTYLKNYLGFLTSEGSESEGSDLIDSVYHRDIHYNSMPSMMQKNKRIIKKKKIINNQHSTSTPVQ